MIHGNGLAKKAQKEADKLNQQRLRELIPTAKEVLKIIADANLDIGEFNMTDNVNYYNTAKEILALLLQNNIKYVDRQFIFQLILQPFEGVKDIVFNSLNRSFDLSLEKSFGKEFREVRLEDIDKMIKRTL